MVVRTDFSPPFRPIGLVGVVVIIVVGGSVVTGVVDETLELDAGVLVFVVDSSVFIVLEIILSVEPDCEGIVVGKCKLDWIGSFELLSDGNLNSDAVEVHKLVLIGLRFVALVSLIIFSVVTYSAFSVITCSVEVAVSVCPTGSVVMEEFNLVSELTIVEWLSSETVPN